MKFKNFLISALVVTVLILRAEVPSFKSGEKICFLGDSITKQGGYHYQIQLFYATRFPYEKIIIWNCGLAGNTAADMLNRYKWDVMEHTPDVVCVMAGMNDVHMGLYHPNKSGKDIERKRKQFIVKYIDNMDKLINGLLEAKVRVIIITPSIYDQTGKQKKTCMNGTNDALGQCSDGAMKLAEKYRTGLVEFFTPMEKLNMENQKKDSAFTIIGPDRIHPRGVGHLVMAYLFLKTQNLSPIVSSMSINAAKLSVVKQENCTITDLNADEGEIAFDCLEKALPFPTDKYNHKALSLVSFNKGLNKEELKISDLEKGQYELSIDSRKILQTSSEQLARGINLAEYRDTPQYQQAMEVKKLLKLRSKLEIKLRKISHVKFMFLDGGKTMTKEQENVILEAERKKREGKKGIWNNYCLGLIKSYDMLKNQQSATKIKMEELLKMAYTINKPQQHHYVIKRIQ